YHEAFKGREYILGQSGVVEGHAYHLYVILVSERKALYDFLRTNNILCQVHYIPVHTLPYYRELGHRQGDFPLAESYYNKCLSLPMYPTLTSDEQNYVINKIDEFYRK